MNKVIFYSLALVLVLSMSAGAYAYNYGNEDANRSASNTTSANIQMNKSREVSNSDTRANSSDKPGANETRNKAAETREENLRKEKERLEKLREELERKEAKIEQRMDDLNERERKIREFEERVKRGKGILNIDGKKVAVRELSNETKELIAGKINAKTGLNLTAEDINETTMLRAYLSNGRNAYIKVMPDRASENALSKLKAKCAERNCTVELKEVVIGNETKLAYTIESDKDSRVFLIFKKRMIVRAEVDAETGEVINARKPWWAFLASEKDEPADENSLEPALNVSVEENISANASA